MEPEAPVEKASSPEAVKAPAKASAVESLTPYEFVQAPRPLLPSGSILSRTVRSINSELTCPICLGLLHDPVVVRECLHRFCSECIEKCLRLGRKECPSCRIHVPSRRSLRHDTNFESLINKVYPNLQEYEETEEKLIEDSNKFRTNNAFTESCKAGMENQLRRRKNAPGAFLAKRKLESDGAASGGKRAQVERLVHFVLKPHPEAGGGIKLEREYLRASEELKMDNLKSFLGTKIPGKQFDIVVIAAGKTLVLNGELTLKEVREHFWDGDNDLVLHFQEGQ